MVFRLDIPPLFSVMSALITALFFGLGIAWTKSETLSKLFSELERVVTWLVTRVLIPILPFFDIVRRLGSFARLSFKPCGQRICHSRPEQC